MVFSSFNFIFTHIFCSVWSLSGQMEKCLSFYGKPGFLFLWREGYAVLSVPVSFLHRDKLYNRRADWREQEGGQETVGDRDCL